MSLGKAAIGALPAAVIASPAFAMDSIVEAMPSTTLSLEVQFGAYLAVLLGTFLPCLFLINLFINKNIFTLFIKLTTEPASL